jgi:hypothetical protein
MKKVYLPRWQRWYIFPLFGGLWVFFTYLEFFSDIEDKMGLVGHLFMSAFFLGLGLVFYLMTSGRLPAYIIKDENEKEG